MGNPSLIFNFVPSLVSTPRTLNPFLPCSASGAHTRSINPSVGTPRGSGYKKNPSVRTPRVSVRTPRVSVRTPRGSARGGSRAGAKISFLTPGTPALRRCHTGLSPKGGKMGKIKKGQEILLNISCPLMSLIYDHFPNFLHHHLAYFLTFSDFCAFCFGASSNVLPNGFSFFFQPVNFHTTHCFF